MRVGIVLNSRSGTAPGETALHEALDRAGLAADILPVPAAMGAGGVDEAAASYDVLVAAGGDGTVSTVAAAVVRHNRTLGVLPCGTLNHFARDTGIPSDLDGAIAVLAAGHSRMLDVGDVNGHLFINNASIGAYPRMVWERNKARRKGLPRPLAVGLAVARTWFDLRSIAVRLSVDGVDMVRSSPFLFVGNSEYEIQGTSLGKRMTMTDGKLSLYMAPKFDRLDAVMLPARVLMHTLEQHEKFEAMSAAAIAMETSSARVAVGLDGEIRTLQAPLKFTVRRSALRTILPASEPL